MKTIKFYGHSDDIIMFYDGKELKERYAYLNSDDRIQAIAVIGGMVRVYCIYDECWSFSIGQVNENIDFPNWPIRVRPGNEEENDKYSMTLEIDVEDSHSYISWEGLDYVAI